MNAWAFILKFSVFKLEAIITIRNTCLFISFCSLVIKIPNFEPQICQKNWTCILNLHDRSILNSSQKKGKSPSVPNLNIAQVHIWIIFYYLNLRAFIGERHLSGGHLISQMLCFKWGIIREQIFIYGNWFKSYSHFSSTDSWNFLLRL